MKQIHNDKDDNTAVVVFARDDDDEDDNTAVIVFNEDDNTRMIIQG